MEAVEEVIQKLDGMGESEVILDSGLSLELERLKGNLVQMQSMDLRGYQAHLVELTAGTTTALEQMEANLEKTSAGRKVARAHATARAALPSR